MRQKNCSCKKNLLFYVIIIIIMAFAAFISCKSGKKEFTLVKNGKPNSVIVVPETITPLQQSAIEEFIKIIKRSSSAEIQVMTEEQSLTMPRKMVRIYIGPSPLTESMGYSGTGLKPEEFRIVTGDNAIIILAKDNEGPGGMRNSMVTSWAFTFLLDHYVGVRWLWPGELGTFVPVKKTIRVPEINISQQPKLLSRWYRLRENPDNSMWAAHHQAGRRVNYRFGHSFRTGQDNGEWWNRLSKTHPEFFAKNPQGKISYTNNDEEFFKLCISNQGVRDEIIRLWEEAGKPDYWDVTPNDGNGFCTCDSCRALDLRYGDTTWSKEEIWSRPDYVNLTDRYVWHWNTLIRLMREKNPEVRIGVYFYSAYRNPPKKLKLEKGIVGSMVHGYDFSFWKAWKEAGAEEIGLRPNWWHMGANAPNLPLHVVGSYIENARKEGMTLIEMDSLMEYWAAQSPYYYLVVRLISRPDLNTEDVIEEFCEAFGGAAGDIRKYIDFWEEYTTRIAYNIPAGGALSQNPDGYYETVCREKFRNVLHPLGGHWKTMPFIYIEDILKNADDILDNAITNAGDENIKKRINFLRAGLTQVRLVISVIEAKDAGRQEAIKTLTGFSDEMQKKYGYWGSNGLQVMQRRGVIKENVDLNGL